MNKTMGEVNKVTIPLEDFINFRLFEQQQKFSLSIIDQLKKDKESLVKENDGLKKKIEEVNGNHLNKIDRLESLHQTTVDDLRKKIGEIQSELEKERGSKMKLNYEFSLLKFKFEQMEKENEKLTRELLLDEPPRKLPKYEKRRKFEIKDNSEGDEDDDLLEETDTKEEIKELKDKSEERGNTINLEEDKDKSKDSDIDDIVGLPRNRKGKRRILKNKRRTFPNTEVDDQQGDVQKPLISDSDPKSPNNRLEMNTSELSLNPKGFTFLVKYDIILKIVQDLYRNNQDIISKDGRKYVRSHVLFEQYQKKSGLDELKEFNSANRSIGKDRSISRQFNECIRKMDDIRIRKGFRNNFVFFITSHSMIEYLGDY